MSKIKITLILCIALFSAMVNAMEDSIAKASIALDSGIMGEGQEAGVSLAYVLHHHASKLNTEIRYGSWFNNEYKLNHLEHGLGISAGYDIFHSTNLYSSLGFGINTVLQRLPGDTTAGFGDKIGYFYSIHLNYGVNINKQLILYNRNMLGFGPYETGAVAVGLMYKIK